MLTSLALHLGATAYVAYGAVQTAESSAAASPFESFLQYGVLGAVVIGFLTEWIVPGSTAKKYRDEATRLQAIVEEKVLPVTATYGTTLERTNIALEKAGQAMQALAESNDMRNRRSDDRDERRDARDERRDARAERYDQRDSGS